MTNDIFIATYIGLGAGIILGFLLGIAAAAIARKR